MKRDWNAMAQGILDAVGGPENISGMTHCATRLRLNLKDDAACDDAAVKEVEGVVNTLNKAGQYQVLIGTEVPKLYEKFEPLVKGSGVEISAATKDEGESIVSQIFSAISGIFAPLLPAMAGSGILRGFVIWLPSSASSPRVRVPTPSCTPRHERVLLPARAARLLGR